jgi:hypothetical protein
MRKYLKEYRQQNCRSDTQEKEDDINLLEIAGIVHRNQSGIQNHQKTFRKKCSPLWNTVFRRFFN